MLPLECGRAAITLNYLYETVWVLFSPEVIKTLSYVAIKVKVVL